MERLQWKREYEIGHELIDQQHKVLIELVNKLNQSIFSQEKEKIIDEVLQEITDYVKTHFSTEEEIMRSINFQEIESHKKEHKFLISEIKRFKESNIAQKSQEVEEGDNHTILSKKISVFLEVWLIDHILVKDMRLKEYLK